MWVPKLSLTCIRIGIFGPKTPKFGPKYAARTSCVIATPGKGQLLSRKNGGKNWPTPPFNGQRHQQRIRSVSSCPLMSVTKSGPCWKYELTTLADYRISIKRWWIYVDDEMNRKDFEVDVQARFWNWCLVIILLMIWCLVVVKKFNLGRDCEARFGQDF